MRVYVLDDYQGLVRQLTAISLLEGLPIELTILNEHLATEGLLEKLRDAECLILIRERTQLSAAVIEQLPHLELVIQTGRLAGCIDLPACERRGIAVREGTGSPIAPAELTWALILAAQRRLIPYVDQLRQGAWQRTSQDLTAECIGQSVAGKTLGIWGFGKIGSRVASYGKAFGMRVVVHGREQSRVQAEASGFEYIADRPAFLEQVDILSLHLKLNAETRGLITSADLGAMRQEALFVNTSRAELIAPGALLAALDQGRPGMGALDVFENEPDGANPYLRHPRVLATPHLGFVERDTYEMYFGQAFRQLREFVEAKIV